MNRGLSLLLAAVYLVLMARAEGFQSALALAVPVTAVVALIWNADALSQYTGWAGRVGIRSRSPALLVRIFGWSALLTPGFLLLWQWLF